jgi:hypothetical protein
MRCTCGVAERSAARRRSARGWQRAALRGKAVFNYGREGTSGWTPVSLYEAMSCTGIELVADTRETMLCALENGIPCFSSTFSISF